MILSYIVSIFFILVGMTSIVTKKCFTLTREGDYTEESKRKMSLFGGIAVTLIGVCLLGGNITEQYLENEQLWQLFHGGLYVFVILYIIMQFSVLKKKPKF